MDHSLRRRRSFKHVVTNLISNAIKFNKHDGSIKISYTDNETHKQLHVSDTGAGIPQKRWPKSPRDSTEEQM